MFEGKPPLPPGALARHSSAAGPATLREVDWQGLVARLAAARELRAIAGDQGMIGSASFDPASARHIAQMADGIDAVNHDASAYGKAGGVSSSEFGSDDQKPEISRN